MSPEEKLPSWFLLTTVEKAAGYARALGRVPGCPPRLLDAIVKLHDNVGYASQAPPVPA